MAFDKLRVFVFCFCNSFLASCMEPLPPFASQPVLQAGEPIVVNVDYDVPAFGAQDAAVNAQVLSKVHHGIDSEPIRNHEFSVDSTSWPEHAPSSFLSTRVLPVDAERIHKSLYLTQPLRSPPQASVNVIMHEDVQGMKDDLKYKGMVDQTRLLHNDFVNGLATMSNGVA